MKNNVLPSERPDRVMASRQDVLGCHVEVSFETSLFGVALAPTVKTLYLRTVSLEMAPGFTSPSSFSSSSGVVVPLVLVQI